MNSFQVALRPLCLNENQNGFSDVKREAARSNTSIGTSNEVFRTSSFVQREQHNTRRRIYSDGIVEEGCFEKGKLEKGKRTYSDGTCEIGVFVQGKLHGKGIRIYTDGVYYKGDFVGEKRMGVGRDIYPNGVCYEGGFKNDVKSGQGKYILNNGSSIEGNFVNGLMDSSGVSLDHDLFVSSLLGTNSCDVRYEFPLGIICAYLMKKGYQKDVEDLKSLWAFLFQSDNDLVNQSKKIYDRLHNERGSFLIYYGCEVHSIGLNLAPRKGGVIECEFYNSGCGLLEYHEKYGDKFATKLSVIVPEEGITTNKIIQFLTMCESKNIRKAYSAVLKIKGAQVIPSMTTVTQTIQKSENCALEWIFAYLKNTMGEERYTQMRLQLFKDCKDAIEKKARETNTPAPEETIKELERKIAKRVVKLERIRSGILPDATPPGSRSRRREVISKRLRSGEDDLVPAQRINS